MRTRFKTIRFRPATLERIEQANGILRDYAGMRVTLRQLYYQFVARGMLDNTERNYKQLGEIVSNARLSGLLDWDAIEDRTRSLTRWQTYDSVTECVEQAAKRFALDLWANQPMRVEVWVEKEALAGAIEGACQRLRVPFFACRGYASQSALHEAGARMRRSGEVDGQPTVVLHLGDHDPSGIDMTRDNETRLGLFSAKYALVERIALNMDQIEAYQPPPNPAKVTDSRFGEYVATHGDQSWELDALPPDVLSGLIQEHVLAHRDAGLWAEAVQAENDASALLDKTVASLEGLDRPAWTGPSAD